jgi:DNA-binding transcriptional LysR family regulator
MSSRNLNDIHFFMLVAQTHSFTRAAKKLGVPKSAASRAVTRLEDRLGVRLLERTTRTVCLTEVGETYFEHCQKVMEEVEQADLAVGALLAKPRGRLRIATPVAFARAILGPILKEFLFMYPELRVHLQLLNGDSTAREGSFDILIRPGPLEDSGLLVKPLMRIQLGVFASPDYLMNRELPASPIDLRDHDCITTGCGAFGEPADSATWRLCRGTERREIRVDSRVSVADPMLNHQLAIAGVGLALLAQSVVQMDINQGRLVRVLPDWEPESIEFHALYSSRLNSSPKVRAFLHFLRQHLGSNRDRRDSTESEHRNVERTSSLSVPALT